MAPFLHQLSFPKYLTEQYSKGQKDLYNSYAFAYVRANNPNMLIVTIKGQQQDPYKQGFVYAVYKEGYSPRDKAEAAKMATKAAGAANKKTKGKK